MDRISGQEPRVGCGAAIVDGSRVLLVKRLRDPEAGCWGLPGGKVEWRERVEDAVIREVEEELGVVLSLTRLLCVVNQLGGDSGQHWIAPVYLALIEEGRPAIREPEALAEFGWFEFDALPPAITEATRQAMDVLSVE